MSSKDSILSKRSRICLFVRRFSLISFHLVPVMALTYLLKHTLSRPRSSDSSAQVSQPHKNRYMAIAMKRRTSDNRAELCFVAEDAGTK